MWLVVITIELLIIFFYLHFFFNIFRINRDKSDRTPEEVNRCLDKHYRYSFLEASGSPVARKYFDRDLACMDHLSKASLSLRNKKKNRKKQKETEKTIIIKVKRKERGKKWSDGSLVFSCTRRSKNPWQFSRYPVALFSFSPSLSLSFSFSFFFFFQPSLFRPSPFSSYVLFSINNFDAVSAEYEYFWLLKRQTLVKRDSRYRNLCSTSTHTSVVDIGIRERKTERRKRKTRKNASSRSSLFFFFLFASFPFFLFCFVFSSFLFPFFF